jgi:hypothetical protein
VTRRGDFEQALPAPLLCFQPSVSVLPALWFSIPCAQHPVDSFGQGPILLEDNFFLLSKFQVSSQLPSLPSAEFCGLSSFWGGHVPTPTPPSGFKGQASQAAGSWPGGHIMRIGVLTNHLGSSNHFVFSSRIKGQTTKCLLNIRSWWASR